MSGSARSSFSRKNNRVEEEYIEHAHLEKAAASSSPEYSSEAEPANLVAFPNRWSKIRYDYREYFAEFLGTGILVVFGTAVDCQVTLSANPLVAPGPKGDYLALAFAWAAGVGLGVWVSGGISGGHINPAVTIALAVFRDFPWRKVPGYIAAQMLGGIIGSLIVYANYINAIDLQEGGRHVRTVPGTASIFATYALPYMTNASAFFDEFFGAAILLICVLSFGDNRNGPPPPGLAPLALFILVLAIGTALGMQTGYAINPARDLGPRIMTAMVGYGKEVFNFRNQYWLWCPVIAPILGALFGSLVYDALIFTGDESILNRPNKAMRSIPARAPRDARDKLPAGIDNV